MTFLRRRFHDEPDIELQSMAAEPARPPPSTPKQVYWRYGKQCVRESEKTKMAVDKFDMEMATIHSAPPSCVSVLEQTKSEASISPRGPRTERARASASDLGSIDATITDQRDDEDHRSPPTSPRAQRNFFRRIFSRKGTHPRALADCAE